MSQHVLVLDCHEHTLTVVRSLARANYTVTLGVTRDNLARGFVHASRQVASTWLHPDIVDDAQSFKSALLEFLDTHADIKLIFPVGENSVRGLAAIRADLPHGATVAMPDNDVVYTCLDKPSAYWVADKCQVPVANTRTVNSAEGLRSVIDELGLPAIAKASDSSSLLLGKKCVFIRTASDLEEVVSNWPAGQDDIIVQNEIKGRRYNCDIVAVNGQIKLYFESEILRTDQIDYAGNSVFDRSISPTPVHQEYCEKLIAELNYTGLTLIQFLKDAESGNSYFLEANPRAGSTIGLAVNCGVDMPAASVRAHLGVLSDCDTHYPLNRSQNWLHGDLLGIRKARINGEIGMRQTFGWLVRALIDFIRADYHTSFVWTDPMPTVKLYWNLLVRVFVPEKRGATD